MALGDPGGPRHSFAWGNVAPILASSSHDHLLVGLHLHFPLLRRMSVILDPKDLIFLTTSAKILFLIRSHSQVLGVRTAVPLCICWEGNSTHNDLSGILELLDQLWLVYF